MSGFDFCDCSCHRMEGVYHCMPCCIPCPHCNSNVSYSAWERHIKECEHESKTINIEPVSLYKHDN